MSWLAWAGGAVLSHRAAIITGQSVKSVRSVGPGVWREDMAWTNIPIRDVGCWNDDRFFSGARNMQIRAGRATTLRRHRATLERVAPQALPLSGRHMCERW